MTSTTPPLSPEDEFRSLQEGDTIVNRAGKKLLLADEWQGEMIYFVVDGVENCMTRKEFVDDGWRKDEEANK